MKTMKLSQKRLSMHLQWHTTYLQSVAIRWMHPVYWWTTLTKQPLTTRKIRALCWIWHFLLRVCFHTAESCAYERLQVIHLFTAFKSISVKAPVSMCRALVQQQQQGIWWKNIINELCPVRLVCEPNIHQHFSTVRYVSASAVDSTMK